MHTSKTLNISTFRDPPRRLTRLATLTMNQPPDTDTTDSGVDTDMSSDWMSVNSQNYEFREEKGRRSAEITHTSTNAR